MISLPAIHSDLEPQDLSQHFDYLAKVLPNRSTFEIAFKDYVIPCQRMDYVTKGTTISLKFRVSDFGRPMIDQLHDEFRKMGYETKSRRSTKRRLLSQFSVVLIRSETFALDAVSIIRSTCRSMDISCPPRFTIAYAIDHANSKLPGEFRIDHPLWKVGHSIGKAVGGLWSNLQKS